MIYRPLGKTGFSSSLIGFGGASLSGEGGGYGMGPISEKESEILIKSAIDLGLNTFDTAPIYGFGLSEERLGRHLPKDQFLISKGGVDWHENKRVNMSNDPKIILKMLHESLKRLKRDVIDLYMIHWPDAKIDITYPLEILKKAKEQGKIRFVGLCNTNQQDLSKAKEITSIEVIQSEYNYFNQNAFIEIKDFLSSDTGFISWGTFDKGILTGRVTKDRKFDSVDARSWAPWWKQQNLKEKLSQVDQLKNFGKQNNLTLLDLALAFQFKNPKISSALVGLRSIEDLKQCEHSLKKIQNLDPGILKIF